MYVVRNLVAFSTLIYGCQQRSADSIIVTTTRAGTDNSFQILIFLWRMRPHVCGMAAMRGRDHIRRNVFDFFFSATNCMIVQIEND